MYMYTYVRCVLCIQFVPGIGLVTTKGIDTSLCSKKLLRDRSCKIHDLPDTLILYIFIPV